MINFLRRTPLYPVLAGIYPRLHNFYIWLVWQICYLLPVDQHKIVFSNFNGGVITYICMATGIVSKSFAYGGWNMPAPIAAFIATLDVKAFILAIALIIIDALVYLPFFKVYEKQKLAEETAVPTEE